MPVDPARDVGGSGTGLVFRGDVAGRRVRRDHELLVVMHRARSDAAAVEQLGLVAGEARVREGDVEGVFIEALDIQHGRLWIAVGRTSRS